MNRIIIIIKKIKPFIKENVFKVYNYFPVINSIIVFKYFHYLNILL
jgi:hypothetical protein